MVIGVVETFELEKMDLEKRVANLQLGLEFGFAIPVGVLERVNLKWEWSFGEGEKGDDRIGEEGRIGVEFAREDQQKIQMLRRGWVDLEWL
jgi:hypothetical protein